MTRALLVVDHGSRVALANESVAAVAELVAQLGDYALVIGAHMELAAPSIPEAIDDAVQRGATDLTVVPFMLAPGRHATQDIPRIVAECAADHAGLVWRIAAPLGVHALLAQLVLARAHEATAQAAHDNASSVASHAPAPPATDPGTAALRTAGRDADPT